MSHRDAVGRGKKYRIALLKLCTFRVRKGQVHVPPQTGEHRGHGGAGILARGNRLQLHLRMGRQNPEQFHPGVTGTADDPDFYHLPQHVT